MLSLIWTARLGTGPTVSVLAARKGWELDILCAICAAAGTSLRCTEAHFVISRGPRASPLHEVPRTENGLLMVAEVDASTFPEPHSGTTGINMKYRPGVCKDGILYQPAAGLGLQGNIHTTSGP